MQLWFDVRLIVKASDRAIRHKITSWISLFQKTLYKNILQWKLCADPIFRLALKLGEHHVKISRKNINFCFYSIFYVCLFGRYANAKKKQNSDWQALNEQTGSKARFSETSLFLNKTMKICCYPPQNTRGEKSCLLRTVEIADFKMYLQVADWLLIV